jgi:hypothetical protein
MRFMIIAYWNGWIRAFANDLEQEEAHEREDDEHHAVAHRALDAAIAVDAGQKVDAGQSIEDFGRDRDRRLFSASAATFAFLG